MKLKRLFQSKASAFKEAIATDDRERMRELLGGKGNLDFYLELLRHQNFQHMSAGMAQLLVNELDDKVMDRWLKGNKPQIFFDLFLSHAIANKRLDLVDIFMTTKVDYNEGSGDSGLIPAFIDADFPEAEKLPRLKKMFTGGIDRIKEPQKLMQAAVEKNLPAIVDFLVETGLDIHGNNEQYLRAAAKAGHYDMARHLIDRYKADPELAARTARHTGAPSEWIFLDGLKPSEAEKPATLESLSAEVRELKAAVRELTALVTELQGPKALDKPALRGPQP